MYFYRYPQHTCLDNYPDQYVTGPSFGTVAMISHDLKNKRYNIAITLQLYDIHRQYYPVNGIKINQVRDKNGIFNIAFDLSKSKYNEKVITSIQMKHNPNNIVIVTQIAGMIARRIDNKNDKPLNSNVKIGDTLGIIHLGSRVDISIPSDNFVLLAKLNQKIKSCNSVIGYYV